MIRIFVFLFLVIDACFGMEPEFEGLEQQQVIQPSSADSQQERFGIENNKSFWKRLRTKFLKGSVEDHFPQAESPKQSDILLHFDDRVVNSFSDHMVAEQVPMVYELSYHIQRSQLRVKIGRAHV